MVAGNQGGKHLPPEETSMFCAQVALILKSGIPLYDRRVPRMMSRAMRASKSSVSAFGETRRTAVWPLAEPSGRRWSDTGTTVLVHV